MPKATPILKTLTFAVAYPLGLGVSPNERVHWRRKAERNGLVRDLTQGHAAAAVRATAWPCADVVTVDIAVMWGKGARTKDEDNLLGMLKPLLDGLVRARVVVDDSVKHFRYGQVTQSHDPKAYWPVVTITVRAE